MESAASVIAIIQLTGSLVKLCGGYIREVKDARNEILTLQRTLTGLQEILQELQEILQGDKRKTLPTSSRLVSSITDCCSELQTLEARLDLGKGKRLMRKVGLRALKWPLKCTEVECVMKNLERYKSSFLLSLQVDQTSLMVGVVQNTERINQHIDLGKLEGVIEAEFESFSNRDEVECLQGTRTELLQEIMEWATSPSSRSIFWLKGMAGTGKSTICRTVARSLKDTNHLGASFFFKRGEGDRGNAKKFFPTLIRQLVLWSSDLRPSVQKALNDDPSITSKSLREQFEKLLLQPLLSLEQSGRQSQSTVVVIDALDECEHDQDIRNIIQLLPLLQKAGLIRLRIFLTSRPELPISLGFSEIGNQVYQDLALHDISEQVTEHDIHLFLQDRFAKIRYDRNISQDWPGNGKIQELVRVCIPLFISAATVCRYIENSRWEPKLRLQELLKDQSKYVSRMDKTYLPILTRLLDDQESNESEQQQLLQEFQDIVGVIVLLAIPLSINTLSLFLGIDADQINNRLDLFRSVLKLPCDRDQPVRILHLSFRDFLVESRTKFHVDEPSKHKEIAKLCLKTMQTHLRKDIRNLSSPGARTAEIDPQDIHQYIPPELQYSCRYWMHHLKQSHNLANELTQAFEFLRSHFLHWIEAMSLLDATSEAVGTIQTLRVIVQDDKAPEISEFLHDAWRFILKNRQIADTAPLQLYSSALIFAPGDSIVRRLFQVELSGWKQIPQVEVTWDGELQTLEGHTSSVCSVVFSPNGQLLVSGSQDNTIKLWDPNTGELHQTLDGHLDSVRSIAFSPDSQLLASGSHDSSVKLWNSRTGELCQTFEGHSGYIYSVTFSPNGQLLASGSVDKAIKLWDPTTGELCQTLWGHSSTVLSVAFSPSGKQLASGSHDNTIKLWDPTTGELQQTLTGHEGPIRSIDFSYNNQVLASGSHDKTIRLWNPKTGELRHTLKGHSNWVYSLAFNNSGQLLASGSIDNTIMLWDTNTGKLHQTLKGHSNSVLSVTFSPNNQLLASGSHDKSIKLWDLSTPKLHKTLKGHLHRVCSVSFSLNGQLLASSSVDNTIKLWDPNTGELHQTLGSHSSSVFSVAFSLNGQLLASGSHDNTIKLWNLGEAKLCYILRGHSGSVNSVAFSPDSQLLASGSDDNTIKLWDLHKGELRATLHGHSNMVLSVAFSPDGKLLASGSHDNTIKLWDICKCELRKTIKGHSGFVYSVTFSSSGRMLASSSNDNTVKFWDPYTGDLCQTLEGHSNWAWSQGIVGVSILENQWICCQGKRILWLPQDFRPTCLASTDDILALGHLSGRVSFISRRQLSRLEA